jgi:TolB-like protein/class 3 adenylate cyclase
MVCLVQRWVRVAAAADVDVVMERKLAAILAADVVGYSGLMERDEAGTFERLRARRKEIFEPEVEKHHGRIFKLTGDGVLAEFASVVGAIECAVSVQRGMAERNASVQDDKRIDVRIGINLGEVIVEGDDRYGEGVNVAARLEQLADPGGICVSGKVAREVEKKLAFAFEPMGQQRMKNIAEPVEAFRVKIDGARRKPMVRPPWSRRQRMAIAALPALLIVAGGAVALTEYLRNPAATSRERPSIAVLPFTNMSADPQQDYLADGISEDLITDLAKVSGLFVISRNSTFVYKGKAVVPAEVADALGVRYLLEGSVRRDGDRLRVNAQLIDAKTSGHLWADRYDRTMTDVFALQDDITRGIVAALKVQLSESDQGRVAQVETADVRAYDAFLQGWELYRNHTPQGHAAAIPYLERAIAFDPSYGRAHAASPSPTTRSSIRGGASSWDTPTN